MSISPAFAMDNHAFFKKFLEFDSRKDYHITILCGLGWLTFSQGRQLIYFNPPPLLIKKKTYFSSILRDL